MPVVTAKMFAKRKSDVEKRTYRIARLVSLGNSHKGMASADDRCPFSTKQCDLRVEHQTQRRRSVTDAIIYKYWTLCVEARNASVAR